MGDVIDISAELGEAGSGDLGGRSGLGRGRESSQKIIRREVITGSLDLILTITDRQSQPAYGQHTPTRGVTELMTIENSNGMI